MKNLLERNQPIIDSLRTRIRRDILPLVTSDYHLTNLPYHNNLGDALIWNGACDLLRESGHRCLSQTSQRSWHDSYVKPNDIIILDGGGNFGDVWRENQEFLNELVIKFPNNRIILLPNSAWYNDINLLESDSVLLSHHKDLHLFARDSFSLDIFRRHFSANYSYLTPDMAFYINPAKLAKYRKMLPDKGAILYLKRTDKELKDVANGIAPGVDQLDWPTMTSPSRFELKGYALLYRCLRYEPLHRFANRVAARIIRDRYVGIGSQFIARYDKIVTTRLHTMILAFLLGREVEYIDNSTAKLSAFAQTWLHDADTVRPYDKSR